MRICQCCHCWRTKRLDFANAEWKPCDVEMPQVSQLTCQDCADRALRRKHEAKRRRRMPRW